MSILLLKGFNTAGNKSANPQQILKEYALMVMFVAITSPFRLRTNVRHNLSAASPSLFLEVPLPRRHDVKGGLLLQPKLVSAETAYLIYFNLSIS
jgi:hypothetical protein